MAIEAKQLLTADVGFHIKPHIHGPKHSQSYARDRKADAGAMPGRAVDSCIRRVIYFAKQRLFVHIPRIQFASPRVIV